MGWESRIPRGEKTPHEYTCNKCGGTGVRITYVGAAGVPYKEPVKVECKCVQPRTPTAEGAGLEPVQ